MIRKLNLHQQEKSQSICFQFPVKNLALCAEAKLSNAIIQFIENRNAKLMFARSTSLSMWRWDRGSECVRDTPDAARCDATVAVCTFQFDLLV